MKENQLMEEENILLAKSSKSILALGAKVLANAFQKDPLWVYFFQNELKRFNKLVQIFKMAIQYGISHGKVYATSEKMEGVAIWLPDNKVDMSLYQIIRSGGLSVLQTLNLKEMIQSLQFSNFSSAIHNKSARFRHCHLQCIGIHSEFQGKGFASKLIKPMLKKLDVEKTPCSLDTQNKENVHLYQHYKFRVVSEKRIPGTSIGHWFMVRP